MLQNDNNAENLEVLAINNSNKIEKVATNDEVIEDFLSHFFKYFRI